MAVVTKTQFLKPVYNENLPNRVQTDMATLKFAAYSSVDVTVGAGDTLEFPMITLPADTIISDVWVKVNVANGATLVATLTDASAIVHANTFDLNTAGIDLEPVLASKRPVGSEVNLTLVFQAAAVIKPALEIEVGVSLQKQAGFN